jgi:hypothetical protein
MDDEQGGERRMFISNVNRERLAVELLEIVAARVVNKYEFASLSHF